MAFTTRNLSVLAYANGFTLWHYKAGGDRLIEIGQDGFFADADDMLAAGDIMMVSATDGARLICITPGSAGPLRLNRWGDLQYLLCMAFPTGRCDLISSVRSLPRQSLAGKPDQARAILLFCRPADRIAQHQPVQRGTATGLEIRFTPHMQECRSETGDRQHAKASVLPTAGIRPRG